MNTTETVPTTPERVALDEVLGEVNAIRNARGWAPLDDLPKGSASGATSCVLAHALDAVVVPYSGTRYTPYYFFQDEADNRGTSERPLPEKLTRFAVGFDNGLYPELVA